MRHGAAEMQEKSESRDEDTAAAFARRPSPLAAASPSARNGPRRKGDNGQMQASFDIFRNDTIMALLSIARRALRRRV